MTACQKNSRAENEKIQIRPVSSSCLNITGHLHSTFYGFSSFDKAL